MSKRDSDGRYNAIHRGSVPGELPKPGRRSEHMHIVHGLVDDPNSTRRGYRQRVAVNACTDALETEYARHRISDAAYAAALRYQAALERQGRGPVGSSWSAGDRGDPAERRDHGMVRSLEAARDAVELLAQTRPAIGMLGERILTMALGERRTMTEITELFGYSSTAARAEVSARFRQALEDLADLWAARGATPQASSLAGHGRSQSTQGPHTEAPPREPT